jgi:protein SCO1/2
MMMDLKSLEKSLSTDEKSQVRFAVFSFDSKNETPVTLKSFAEKQAVDLSQWTFYRGPESSVRELAALLGVRFKRLKDGDIEHSNMIIVLDRSGNIVRQQEGLRQKTDELKKALSTILK